MKPISYEVLPVTYLTVAVVNTHEVMNASVAKQRRQADVSQVSQHISAQQSGNDVIGEVPVR